MLRSLVGSEMCIRDSLAASASEADPAGTRVWQITNGAGWVDTSETYVNYIQGQAVPEPCLGAVSYTHLTLPTIYSV